MLDKFGLLAASLVASLVLAVALAAAGFAPGAAPTATADSTSSTMTVADAAPGPQVQLDTVYIAPAPPQQTVTVDKVVRSSDEESGEREGEDDD